ncbi:MinD/ParA family protein [Microbacterium sp. CFBP9034]|uniref:MinD/ParA family ATP-binding protein n=1 Tax=Microbacterium sp. CFBP9034 TaxID=3096540 RepID=UPI002A69A566|nr:MinD/ParA family protein [Microbacterium sp. CFBP9034]MDY0910012.1 MinD/ParA family protein [Microbacterium sp. CFBP9034]
MTPDRPDHTPEESENGVLSETGSLDTSGLGILGGSTAQVSVELPSEPEDDLGDDDVIGDEMPFIVEIPAETAEAEIVESAAGHEDWTFEEGVETTAFVEDIADAELVAETDEFAAATFDALGSATVEADDVAFFDEPDAAASVTTPSAFDNLMSGNVASAPAAAATVAAQPGPPPAAERPQAVERSFPRTDVTMTSKRLGEFEADRETADLLTADRLLDPHQVVRSEPEGVWQHLVYSISGRRINLGDGKRARARKDLDRRISAPLNGGARFVPVLSRKGGVGKTTVTTLLGMALADARDDRVIAVDANPDRGTLAERIARTSGKTVRDLVRIRRDVVGFNDLSSIVARDETRLDVVASDTDPRVSEAFSDVDYRDVATLAAHYYSIVLTDTGTGIVHSVMGATLELADQIVIVAGLSVDEARLASETLTWLETNGYSDKVRGAVVVLNNARPGNPLVQLDELEAHFRTRVRAVVRMPYDPHIAAGSAIVFRDLHPATRLAARDLAATVVEGLRSLATAA